MDRHRCLGNTKALPTSGPDDWRRTLLYVASPQEIRYGLVVYSYEYYTDTLQDLFKSGTLASRCCPGGGEMDL